MNISNKICHRCKSDDGFTVLLNSNGDCYTCDGVGHLSAEHDTLFDLGFTEEADLANEYSMYLQKVLNKLETISVKVKRKVMYQIITLANTKI